MRPYSTWHCSKCDVRWYADESEPCWVCKGPGRPLHAMDSYIRLPSFYSAWNVAEGHIDPYIYPPIRKEQS